MPLTREEKYEYIRKNLDRADIYGAIAEEAAELAAAGAKMERFLRQNNPTPVTFEKCLGAVNDEFIDLLNVCEALYMKPEAVDILRDAKITRWYNRLKKARESK